VSATPQPQTGEEGCASEDKEHEAGLDVFSLNRVPPKRTYTIRVRYKFAGRGKPLPYLEDEE
jgi:hypothetical protein